MAYPGRDLGSPGKTTLRRARLAANFRNAVNVLSIHDENRMSVC